MQQFQKWATSLGALGIALIDGALLLRITINLRADVLLFMGGVGVVLIGFYFITRPRDPTHQKSNVRIALQGANVIVFAVAFIGIVIALNYIVFQQFSRRIDLTKQDTQVLSEQTILILNTLTEPIQVTGFFTPATQDLRTQAEAVLRDYLLKSDKLNFRIIDPDENPALAQKYENVAPGTLVLEKGNRTEKVYNFDENTLTNAILKVTRTTQPAVYFMTGHGEFVTADSEANGLSQLADYLKQVNYKVEALNMATISQTLPADTSAIVLPGPTKKFTAENNALLKIYLDQGGRVLLLTRPGTELGLEELLDAWGLTLENDLVLDPGLYVNNPGIPAFTQFPNLPLTRGLASFGVFFVNPRSIKEKDTPDKEVTALFTTTELACAKTDFEKLKQQPKPQCEESDPKGPFTVGYAVEGAGGGGASPDARGRLIVIGSASFATNGLFLQRGTEGNQQLVYNMVNWLAGQEELIAIQPRDPLERPLSIRSESEFNMIFWTSVALIPLAALVIGGMLWWRRR